MADALPQELRNFAALLIEMFKLLKRQPRVSNNIQSLNGLEIVGKLRRLAHNSGIAGDASLMDRAAFMVGVLFADLGYTIKNTTAFLIIIGAKYDNVFFEDGALDENCAQEFKKYATDISPAELLDIRPPPELPVPGGAFFVYEQLRAYYKLMGLHPPSNSFNIETIMSIRHLYPSHINAYLDAFTVTIENTPLWGLCHVTIPRPLHFLTEPLKQYFVTGAEAAEAAEAAGESDPLLMPQHHLPYKLRIGLMIMFNFAPLLVVQTNIAMMAAHIANTVYTPELFNSLSVKSINISAPEFINYRSHLIARFEQIRQFCEHGRMGLAYEALIIAFKNIALYADLYTGDLPEQRERREQIYISFMVSSAVTNYNIIKRIGIPTDALSSREKIIKYMMIPCEYEFTF